MNQLKLFFSATVVFLVIDLIWLLVISRKLYQTQLGHLMGPVKLVPAGIFYVLYIVGILFFVVNPALAKDSLSYVILAGGLLGLLCYATYDLTNLATLKDWPPIITVIDLIWGTFITSATATGAFLMGKYLFNM